MLDGLADEAVKAVEECSDKASLANLKARFLGGSSVLKKSFGELKAIKDPKEKGVAGKKINEVKVRLEGIFDDAEKNMAARAVQEKMNSEMCDITLPGINHLPGAYHPCTLVIDDLTSFFLGLGYSVASGDDVELDKFNFELVNIPKDHPSRDMQDTFYIDEQRLLRTQTSAAQAHILQDAKGRGPIKIICPGKTYRRDDDDLTHSHQFSQCEGLVVGKDVTMGQLMETLTLMLRHLFGEKREVRFRPSFFPFTEPSIEVDVSCFSCGGKGCPICKNTGWIEVLGAGMVHPNVLRMNGFDADVYTGLAFGIGIERIAMLKYGVDDIRKFFNSDLSFLRQFRKE